MPALPVALGLATGVAASLWIGAWSIALAGICLGIALWIIGRHWWSVFSFCWASGLTLAIAHLPLQLPEWLIEKECEITATVQKASEKDSHVNYILEIEDIVIENREINEFPARVTFRTYSRLEPLPVGTKIRIKGEFSLFESPEAKPWETDMSTYQRVERLSGSFETKTDSLQIVSPPTSIADKIMFYGGTFLKNAIVNTGYNEETTRFLLATLSGDDQMLDAEKAASYRSAGLAHLLALSGLHTGIIYMIAAFLLWWVKILPQGRRIYFSILSACVMLYALAVGFTPSVARAAMMVCVFSLAKMIERIPQPCNTLCVTIAIWLIYSPEWLFGASFQMSVAAVAAIIWVNHLTKDYDSEHHKQRKIILIFAIPVVAMAATVALSVFYFNTFPVYFLIANILVTYPATLVIGGAAVCTLLSTLGLKSTILPAIIDLGYSLIEAMVTRISHWPNALIEGIQPSVFQYAAYIALLICIVWMVQYRRKAAAIGTIMLVAGLTISFTTMQRERGDEVYILGKEHFSTILLRHNDTVALYGNIDSTQFKIVSEKLHSYAVNNGAHDIFMADSQFTTGQIHIDNHLLRVGGKTMVIINHNKPLRAHGHVDYLYLSEKWRGDVIATSRAINADTVIISEGINKKRRERYLATLRLIGQPAKSAPATIYSAH